jgi:imidazolonepropionase-like amidohydrolase
MVRARAVATVLRNGRVIDVRQGEHIDRASVVIEDGRITSLGRRNEVSAPDGAVSIDLEGKTVIPGLIDSHLHLWGLDSDRLVDELLMVPEGVRLIRASQRVHRLLEAGYTTVKDCGGTNALHIRRAIAEGTISGPRVVAAGYFLSQTFGHGDFFQSLPMRMADARETPGVSNLTCDGVAECSKAARYALRQGADFIKISTSGGVMSEHDRSEHVQFTDEEVRAIVRVAQNVGTFVTAHCHSTEGMHISVDAGVRTIDHALYPDHEVLEKAKRKGVVFVSTLSIMKRYNEGGVKVGYPEWAVQKSRVAWERTIANMRLIHESGAVLAAGTDFLDSPLMQMGTNALELELLVRLCGLSALDALRAATINGARACGLEGRVGAIEPGMDADLVVCRGDPLKDIRVLQKRETVAMVIKDGRIVRDSGLPQTVA